MVDFVKLHKVIDYVPIVSNFKNILDLIVKKTSKAGQETLDAEKAPLEKSAKKAWSDFANNKSNRKIAFLMLVPIISNIALVFLNRKTQGIPVVNKSTCDGSTIHKVDNQGDNTSVDTVEKRPELDEDSTPTDNSTTADLPGCVAAGAAVVNPVEEKSVLGNELDRNPKRAKKARKVRFDVIENSTVPESKNKEKGRPSEFFTEVTENLPPSVRMKYLYDGERTYFLDEAHKRRMAIEKRIPRSKPSASERAINGDYLKSVIGSKMQLNWLQLQLLEDCYFFIISKFKVVPEKPEDLHNAMRDFIEEKNLIEEEFDAVRFKRDEKKCNLLLRLLSEDLRCKATLACLSETGEAITIGFKAFDEYQWNILDEEILDLCWNKKFREELQQDIDFLSPSED